MNEPKHTIALFIDLSKAFDTIAHDILFKKLKRYGIRGVCLDWLRSYLKVRPMQVRGNCLNEFDPTPNVPLNIGTPQGSCLGPLLFLLYCNDLYLNLETIGCILFADDTTLYYSHKNLKYLNWCVNQDLVVVTDWFKANKLTLNKKKTVAIHFAPNKKSDKSIELFIDKTVIPLVDHAKFLGLWIDSKLDWSVHTEKLISKLFGRIGLLNKCTNFLHAHALQILYQAQVLSHIRYGIGIWGNTVPQKVHKILRKIERKCWSLLPKNNKILTCEQLLILEKCKFGHGLNFGYFPKKTIRLCNE